MKRIFIFIPFVFFLYALSFGVTERKLVYPIDVMATGGAGVAGYNKFGLAYVNPASKAFPDFSRFSILEIGVNAGFNSSVDDIINGWNDFQTGGLTNVLRTSLQKGLSLIQA